jgi:hypothetical protein
MVLGTGSKRKAIIFILPLKSTGNSLWETAVQVKGVSGSFAEPEGSPLAWRNNFKYSGVNIGVMGIFYEPLQRCMESRPVLFKA